MYLKFLHLFMSAKCSTPRAELDQCGFPWDSIFAAAIQAFWRKGIAQLSLKSQQGSYRKYPFRHLITDN
jgi:hypothetical protein